MIDDPRDAARWGCAPDDVPPPRFEFPSCPGAAALAAPDASCSTLRCSSSFSILRSLDASLQQQDSVKGPLDKGRIQKTQAPRLGVS